MGFHVTEQPIQILLVQDNPQYAAEFTRTFQAQTGFGIAVSSASTLQEALGFLGKTPSDVVLLDLALKDSTGIETFRKIHAYHPNLPVVILTYLDDELLALQAVREGAQDYLLKADANPKLLRRVILYAIERQRMQARLFNLSIKDELTGLYNRRGFMILAEQQMKFARRSQKGLLFFLADLDGLKQVNDVHGHLQGDIALKMAAEVFQKTFRRSDIIARIGGDEFAIVAIDAAADCEKLIRKRLEENVREANANARMPFQLSISAGCAAFDEKRIAFVEQLAAEADKSLYEQKRLKQKV